MQLAEENSFQFAFICECKLLPSGEYYSQPWQTDPGLVPADGMSLIDSIAMRKKVFNSEVTTGGSFFFFLSFYFTTGGS